MARGVDVLGVCLYPVTGYPGWDNHRHCDAGLFSPVLADGARAVCLPLADELERQRLLFEGEAAAPLRRAAGA
jgi:hypothetical protein